MAIRLFTLFLLVCLSSRAQPWMDALAKTPFPTNSFQAHLTGPVELILKSFQPAGEMRVVLLMPAAADQLYFFDSGRVEVPQNPTLLEALRGLSNKASVRFSFVPPFLLLHMERDSLADPLMAFGAPLRALEQKKVPGLTYYIDRPYDRLVSSMEKITRLKMIPDASDKGSFHFYRLAFAGHDLSAAELLRAVGYGTKTTVVVEKRRAIFQGEEANLFVAAPLTESGLFTPGIEGPACDREGNIYAVNFGRQQTIGRTTPEGKSKVFAALPGVSTGNGIVFDPAGNMFIADYVGHNVLRIDKGSRRVRVFAHDAQMNQPNDLAIAPDGTLFASDPAWKNGTGQLWRIDRDGKTALLATGLGTSNGIEVSPDGKTLYVNESVQRNVWAWTIGPDKSLAGKRLIRQFPDFGFDGMRCDVDGNLYITRHGKGTVVKMTPEGEILREIEVLGQKPSNLCFGGADGRTVYVTEVEHTRLVQFRVDRPGLAWARWRWTPTNR